MCGQPVRLTGRSRWGNNRCWIHSQQQQQFVNEHAHIHAQINDKPIKKKKNEEKEEEKKKKKKEKKIKEQETKKKEEEKKKK